MKRRIAVQWAALCMMLFILLGGCTAGIGAQEPTSPAADVEMVHSLDSSVTLRDDGDAVTTEVWDMTVLRGTEYYPTLSGLGGGQVIDLRVYDEGGRAYRVMGRWGAGGAITTLERIRTSTYSPSKYRRSLLLWASIALFLAVFPYLFSYLGNALHKRRVRLYYQRRGLNCKKAKRRSNLSRVEYHRDLPFQDSLSASLWALQLLDMRPADSDILSAYVLRWVQKGQAQLVSTALSGSPQAGSEAGLLFLPEQEEWTAQAEKLELETHSLLVRAAQADRILASKTLKLWSKTGANADRIVAWKKSATHYGKSVADAQGMTTHLEKSGRGRGTYTDVLSDEGIAEAKKLLGLKRYLTDFTLVHERMPPEVALWQEYLVFASLLGIADEVEAAFSRLYPQYFQTPQADAVSNDHAAYHMVRSISRSISRSFDGTARRRSVRTSLRSWVGAGGTSSDSGGRR